MRLLTANKDEADPISSLRTRMGVDTLLIQLAVIVMD